jgi:hypothetical protein
VNNRFGHFQIQAGNGMNPHFTILLILQADKSSKAAFFIYSIAGVRIGLKDAGV